MRWNTFGRSAAFAAAAGCGAIPWLLVAAPLLGVRGALSFYLVTVAAAYVAGIAPALRHGLAASFLVVLPGIGLAAVAHTLQEMALGLAILLALARSGLLYRARPRRAVALELALGAGALLFARFLVGSSPLSMLLAIWGFLLVQSLFFLVRGIHERHFGATPSDPFEAAQGRANALLDDLAV
jgi:hypothetical protein